MGKELSQLIMSTRNNDSLTYYDVNNVGFISDISIHPYFKQNIIELYVPYDFISEARYNSISNIKYPITFFDAFGPNDTFKKLFDEIKKSTTLSKKEVLDLIKYDTKCVDIIKNEPIVFTLKIEHEDIME